MPRKAKITAVPVEQEQQGVSEDPVEQKTDAEQKTDIINEVNTAPQSDVPQLNAEEEVAEEPKPKPKARAKRSPSRGPSVRLKHNVIDPEPVLTLQVSDQREPEVQAELPVEEAKVDAKVECPACGKMMSQKTLRYSHGPNCVAKKQKTMTEDNLQSASDDWVEHEVQRRLSGRREERATRREAMVAKLVQNAF
jgi:hypothetical protein